MEKQDWQFKKRYQQRYKLGYDIAINEHGRKERIGIFIPSRIKPCSWSEQIYQVHEFGPGKLAAIMPPQKSRNLLKQFHFLKVHLEADDCYILLFDEDKLDMVASAMHLRKKRKLSEQHRQKVLSNLVQFDKKGVTGDEITV